MIFYYLKIAKIRNRGLNMAAMLMYGVSLREKMLKGVNDYLRLASSSYGPSSYNTIIDKMVI